tara:strand:+ start:1163 stop:1348 length:186 start_codon:yes stop_codon:yes gene_type:complete
METMSVFEKSTGTPSYDFIPQLIREEISKFVWIPRYIKDKDGKLIDIKFSIEVYDNEPSKK